MIDPRSVTPKQRAFTALDGFRGIAALSIAVRHNPFSWSHGYPEGLLHESYLAVDFFFVLSGFVLAHAYGEKLKQDLSAGRFMLIRLIRVYPLYFLGLLLALLPTLGSGRWVWLSATAVRAALFVPTAHRGSLFPLNAPAWSLFFELLANLGYGFAARRVGVRGIALFTLLSAVLLIAAVSQGWLGFGTAYGPMDAGPTAATAFAGLARVSYSFFAGVLVHSYLWKAHGSRLRVPWALPFALLTAILFANPSPTDAATFDLISVVIIFPLVVFLGACTEVKLMERPFTTLGLASYGIYVLQMPSYSWMRPVMTYIVQEPLMPPVAWAAFTSVTLLVVIALLADRFFDRPARKALTELAKRR